MTTISLPVVPGRAEDVPEFGREVGRWMADGSARMAMSKCFQLDPRSGGLGLLESEAPRVPQAESFFVNSEMVTLLRAAAPSYPLDAHPPKPLVPHGLLVLQDPVKLWPDAEDRMVAAYWREGLHLVGLAYPPHLERMLTWTPSIWLDSPPGDREDWAPATREAWRVLASLQAMLTQRIAVPRTVRLDRAARRRLQRLGATGPLPPMQVIDLRRIASRDTDGEPSSVNWTRQWIVGGHWRSQFMPGTGTHEPRWIAPFRKGPVNKPLILRERVYRWTR